MNSIESLGFSDDWWPGGDNGWSYDLPDELSPKSVDKILGGEVVAGVLKVLTTEKLSKPEKASIVSLSDSIVDGYNSSFSHEDIDSSLTNIIDDKQEEAGAKMNSEKLQQARKLFCAMLMDSSMYIPDIKRKFFSSSDDAASRCGGISDYIELLAIADRSEVDPACVDSISGEIIEMNSWSDHNEFNDLLGKADPIKQLHLLPYLYRLSKYCDDSFKEGYGHKTLRYLFDSFNNLSSDKNTAPLVKIVSESYSKEIYDWVHLGWVDVGDDKDITDAKSEDEEYEQQKIHEKFPFFGSAWHLTEIAPNVAGIVKKGQISFISDIHSNGMELLDFDSQNNPFGIDEEEAFLLRSAHTPKVKRLINDKLGLDITKIPLKPQTKLLKYMAKADDGRFDALCNTMKKVSNTYIRRRLAENFVATDFGEDFGDSLLDIANSERISEKELEKILNEIDSCRDSIQKISDFYKDFDDKFAREYARAANERLTDSLEVFRAIARSGEARADLRFAGEGKFDYEKALEALEYEAKSLKIISGTLGDVASKKEGAFAEIVLTPDEFKQRTMYNFYSPDHGYVLLYTRPEGWGNFDPMVEYGKNGKDNVGVEASISLIANPTDPFSLPNPFRPDSRAVKNPNFYDADKMNKVSAIRLDREGRKPDEPFNAPDRDPINKLGTISVDLAAIGDREDTPSGKIARLFSAGNALRALRNGGDFTLNHNTRWFDQDRYGTADGFKELVEYVDQMAREWCDSCPPKDDEGFKGAKRAASRRRGRIVRGVA